MSYAAGEVAKMMGFHRVTIVKLFEHEPGVIKIERPTTKGETPVSQHSDTAPRLRARR